MTDDGKFNCFTISFMNLTKRLLKFFQTLKPKDSHLGKVLEIMSQSNIPTPKPASVLKKRGSLFKDNSHGQKVNS